MRSSDRSWQINGAHLEVWLPKQAKGNILQILRDAINRWSNHKITNTGINVWHETSLNIDSRNIWRYHTLKRVIGSRKSKDRQYNGQNKKEKQWSTKYYTEIKYWATRTPLKPGVNSGAP